MQLYFRLSFEVRLMYRRVRELREDRDIPQREIARRLNMSQTGYSKYETGENDIPTAVLIKLSLIYDVSIDYILGMTDEKQRYIISSSFSQELPEPFECVKKYSRQKSQKSE